MFSQLYLVGMRTRRGSRGPRSALDRQGGDRQAPLSAPAAATTAGPSVPAAALTRETGKRRCRFLRSAGRVPALGELSLLLGRRRARGASLSACRASASAAASLIIADTLRTKPWVGSRPAERRAAPPPRQASRAPHAGISAQCRHSRRVQGRVGWNPGRHARGQVTRPWIDLRY